MMLRMTAAPNETRQPTFADFLVSFASHVAWMAEHHAGIGLKEAT